MTCYTADIRKLVREFYALCEIQMSVSLFAGLPTKTQSGITYYTSLLDDVSVINLLEPELFF